MWRLGTFGYNRGSPKPRKESPSCSSCSLKKPDPAGESAVLSQQLSEMKNRGRNISFEIGRKKKKVNILKTEIKGLAIERRRNDEAMNRVIEKLRQTTSSWNESTQPSANDDKISMIEDMESTISTQERSPFSTDTDFEISSEIDATVWRSPFSIEEEKTTLIPRRSRKLSSNVSSLSTRGNLGSPFSSDSVDRKPVIKFLGYHNT